jgi:saxitoxin biosynthesis operon SxtJ-like protein
MAEGIPARLSRSEARRFGLTVGAAFLGLSALLAWRGRPSPAMVCGVLGSVLILFGAVLPGALVPVRRVWMSMALAISKVTTPIFLGVVYFAVFTPIGVVRRLAGRNPMKPRPTGGSFWVARDSGGPQPDDMTHQF